MNELNSHNEKHRPEVRLRPVLYFMFFSGNKRCYFSHCILFFPLFSAYTSTVKNHVPGTERSAETVKARRYIRWLIQNEDLLNAEFERTIVFLLAVAVIIGLLVYRHIRHRREIEDTAREIRENCEAEERRNSRNSGF